MNKIENILLENKKDIDLLLKSANADNKFLQAQLLTMQRLKPPVLQHYMSMELRLITMPI